MITTFVSHGNTNDLGDSLQAQGLCQFYIYPQNDVYSFRFSLGITIFLLGFYLNQQSDSTLRNLRKPGERDYKIPRGGAFEYISAPHFLGEIIEWLGYAIAVNHTSAYAFVLFTMSNLIPRSLSHHKWYHDNFKDYPKNRKAIIPFLL
jgi:3-oxo-5-alpha-steroid 4-dehydrogenase 1